MPDQPALEPNQEKHLAALRNSGERSDEDVAVLTVAYIQRFTDMHVNDYTLAGGMSMFAARRVTQERAEHLLTILESQGLVVEDSDAA